MSEKVTVGVDIMLEAVVLKSLVLIRMEGHEECAIMHQVHQNFFRMVHGQEFLKFLFRLHL